LLGLELAVAGFEMGGFAEGLAALLDPASGPVDELVEGDPWGAIEAVGELGVGEKG
jgi:hypothetical protein